MPLVWAHAEYLKLVRSLADGRVFDLPPQAEQRYVRELTRSTLRSWRFDQQRRTLPAGHTLRIEVLAPARVRWSQDGWGSQADWQTTDSGLGMHYVDLPTNTLSAGAMLRFTFYWPDAAHWEGADFAVAVTAA
jgi:glucoamylase